MNKEKIRTILLENGLKITPQRVTILEALMDIKDHPTADAIKEYVVKNNPNLATGTIYNILETFCQKGIIKKVKTEKDIMRYDIETKSHHHLYCDECDYIENYFDDELDKVLKSYFEKKKLPDFSIKEINLQIIGSYNPHKQK
ncbi:MAG: transcriptional repressor [Bacteroidales bacterium]|jgi:Fur family peroxide stress response transcriptional regulator|nr:transcriptional repressor [Bacteroidales bacterium]